MSKVDNLLEELIESQVDNLIQEDSYYQMFATPLKPASAFKQAHRKQLVEFFKLGDLREQLEHAPELMLELLPSFVSKEEFDQIKKELDSSGEHFVHFVESMSDKPSEKPILFQEMFGLSDETLLRIYDFGADLVKKENYEDANTIFVFLTTMAPHVPSYWIAQGACLQALDRHEEAVAVFNAAKFLNPKDPAPSFYTIESHLALKDNTRAKLELNTLKEIVSGMSGDEKTAWEQKMKWVVV
ncbi:MAG TPA: hypothetical protein PLC42_06070 [Parachlamydiaceae bacterium]|nr:hypothetical protein [Parachlamydiaceae bacterium]